MTVNNAPRGVSSTRYVTLAVVLIVVVGSLILSRFVDVRALIASVLDWIAARGLLGAAIFVALYVVATIAAFPASLLTLGAGAVYGLWIGFALVSLSSVLGATAAFLIARYAARDWVASKISANPRFQSLDQGVAQEGWKLVFLTRLSPVFPFNLQNYGYGLTQIPTLHYVIASWIGMIPGTLMYVYVGHVIGSVAGPGDKRERSPAEWALLALGLIATIAVTILITRIARRSLARVSSMNTPADT